MRKRKTNLRKYLMLGLLLLSLFGEALQGHAEDQKSNQEVGYTVQAILPDTQIDQQKTFFYFQVRPKEKQNIKVRITSTQKDPVTVVVKQTDAYTNGLAEIGYTEDKNFLDASLTQPLSEIATIPQSEITVENFETKDMEIEVAPTESFAGIKLGALEFSNKEEQEADGVSSAYGYRIGLMIAEDAGKYEEAKQLNLVNVFPTLNHGKRAVALNFQNLDPQINKSMKFDVQITKADDDSFMKSLELENGRMAPNSSFDLMVDWGLEQIQPGNYQVKVKVVSASGIWEWDESFEITANQASKLNKEAAYNVMLPDWIKYVIVGLGIFWFVIIGYLLTRRKRWNKGE